jgi:hemerythrin-like domain-containing protein
MAVAPPDRLASRPQPPAFEPLDAKLLSRPLDFLAAEHHRLRAALTQLSWVSKADGIETRRKVARALIRYLEDDYTLHLADEETDFYPLLFKRCADDADLRARIGALQREHAGERRRLEALLIELQAIADRRPSTALSDDPAGPAKSFIDALRRRILWENAVLLPAARTRLNARDLRHLAQKFAERRAPAKRVGR